MPLQPDSCSRVHVPGSPRRSSKRPTRRTMVSTRWVSSTRVGAVTHRSAARRRGRSTYTRRETAYGSECSDLRGRAASQTTRLVDCRRDAWLRHDQILECLRVSFTIAAMQRVAIHQWELAGRAVTTNGRRGDRAAPSNRRLRTQDGASCAAMRGAGSSSASSPGCSEAPSARALEYYLANFLGFVQLASLTIPLKGFRDRF